MEIVSMLNPLPLNRPDSATARQIYSQSSADIMCFIGYFHSAFRTIG